jgi:hypothetical protein
MPSISMFYGLIIYMYAFDNERHHEPHIHVKYQGNYTVISIPDGNVINGSLPTNKLDLVKAWVHIHEEELMANWDLAINGQSPYSLEPLK